MKTINVRGSKNIEEWTLYDLQGQIESRPEGSSLDGVRFGTFKKNMAKNKNDENMCELIVANKQLVEGKETPLKKPLVVLEKVQLEDGSVEYKVSAVIKTKSNFSKRPTPLSPSTSPSSSPAKPAAGKENNNAMDEDDEVPMASPAKPLNLSNNSSSTKAAPASTTPSKTSILSFFKPKTPSTK